MKVTDRFHRFLLLTSGSVLLLTLIAALLIPKGIDVLLINGHHNQFLDSFLSVITYGGDGRLFLPVVIILLFIRFSYSFVAIIAWAGHGLVCSLMKRLVFPTMLRPAGTIDNDLLYFVPGVDVHVNYSFPSGHTATAFCFAILVSLLLRKKWVFVFMMLLALLVGYSRIYLLQHFLVDVVAGAFIGTAIALAVWFLFEHYGKAEWLGRKFEIQVKRASTTTRVPAR